MHGSERSSEGSERVAHLRALVDRTRPISLAEQRVLPVLAAVEPLFATGAGAAGGPAPGLRRGSVVGVAGRSGATTLALALAAGPTRSGSWAAFVGLPELGWAACGELGVDLGRVVAVRPDERNRTAVVAALVDAFDVVVCGFAGVPSATDVRRLTARVRERGSVLVVVGGHLGGVGPARRGWPGVPEAQLTVVESTWSGLDDGAGHLGERRVTVEVGGRRGLDRVRRVELLLPGSDGRIDVAPTSRDAASGTPDVAPVVPLRRVG